MFAPRISSGNQEIEEPDASLGLNPAPGAFAQFIVVVMAAVLVAFLERLLQFVESLHPLARLRTIRRQKRAPKQFDECFWHCIKRRRARRLSHLTRFRVVSICKTRFSDSALQRHLSRAQISP